MSSLDEKIKEFSLLKFEDALSRLEGIVSKMEKGNVELEEMMDDFETAHALSNVCQKRLKDLHERVEVLTKDSPEGQTWREMDTAGIVDSRNDFLTEPQENANE